jgi:hypothetical protein
MHLRLLPQPGDQTAPPSNSTHMRSGLVTGMRFLFFSPTGLNHPLFTVKRDKSQSL